MRRITKGDLLVPALLLLLSAIPMLGGIARFMSLSAPANPENVRFITVPAPIVVHVVGAALYSLLGAFQFSTGFRLRFPAWHRRAGKVLAASGVLVGLTGMWMAAFYEIPRGLQGPILQAVRLVVGSAMVAAIVLGWRSIVRRDVRGHEAWMIRAYALGQGAGTQALVLGPWMALSGSGVGLTRDLLMTLSWAINLVVAELVIRRREGASRLSLSRA
jgi:hypothetical protein